MLLLLILPWFPGAEQFNNYSVAEELLEQKMSRMIRTNIKTGGGGGGQRWRGNKKKAIVVKRCFVLLALVLVATHGLLMLGFYYNRRSYPNTNTNTTTTTTTTSKTMSIATDQTTTDAQREQQEELAYHDKLFVTIVMPSVVNSQGQVQRLRAIADTWGPAARAIFVVHDEDVLTDLPLIADTTTTTTFPRRLLVPPTITTQQGVPRLLHVFRVVAQQLGDYDFSFYVNDHTFVVPEHLSLFLQPPQPQPRYSSTNHLYAGHALRNGHGHGEFLFNSGAAGYVLSKVTLTKLLDRFERDKRCDTQSVATKWLQGNPGLLTARCLHDTLGVEPMDTRTRPKNNDTPQHVFHAYGIVRTVLGDYDNWYVDKHQTIAQYPTDYAELHSGVDCCSSRTITFHYVEHAETRALYSLRRRLSSSSSSNDQMPMNDNELKQLVKRLWPDNKKNGWIGGYAANLPQDNDKESWASFLAVLRKISLPQQTTTRHDQQQQQHGTLMSAS